jgi:hypothetical protein
MGISMSRICFALIVVLTLLSYSAVAVLPNVPSDLAQGPRIESRPTNCETHIAILDVAHHDAGHDGLIIMIGHLGDGERNRDLNQHRMHKG